MLVLRVLFYFLWEKPIHSIVKSFEDQHISKCRVKICNSIGLKLKVTEYSPILLADLGGHLPSTTKYFSFLPSGNPGSATEFLTYTSWTQRDDICGWNGLCMSPTPSQPAKKNCVLDWIFFFILGENTQRNRMSLQQKRY